METMESTPLEKGQFLKAANAIHLEVATIRGASSELLLELGDTIEIVNPDYLGKSVLVKVNNGNKGNPSGYVGSIAVSKAH